MIVFWIIYLFGVVATVLLLYCSLEHGYKITIGDIGFTLIISVFSWVAFVFALGMFFADYVVFTKKIRYDRQKEKIKDCRHLVRIL